MSSTTPCSRRRPPADHDSCIRVGVGEYPDGWHVVMSFGARTVMHDTPLATGAEALERAEAMVAALTRVAEELGDQW